MEVVYGSIACLCWCIVVMYLMKSREEGGK